MSPTASSALRMAAAGTWQQFGWYFPARCDVRILPTNRRLFWTESGRPRGGLIDGRQDEATEAAICLRCMRSG